MSLRKLNAGAPGGGAHVRAPHSGRAPPRPRRRRAPARQAAPRRRRARRVSYEHSIDYTGGRSWKNIILLLAKINGTMAQSECKRSSLRE